MVQKHVTAQVVPPLKLKAENVSKNKLFSSIVLLKFHHGHCSGCEWRKRERMLSLHYKKNVLYFQGLQFTMLQYFTNKGNLQSIHEILYLICVLRIRELY